MKIKRKILLSLLSFIIISESHAQYYDNGFGLSAGANYTTTSKLFLFPNSPDPVVRDQHIPLDDILSYFVEMRYRISEPLVIGVNVEYLEKTITTNNLTILTLSGVRNPDIKDGFLVIPVEFSAYYLLPFSTEFFQFYMGGGLGLYFGKHIRKFESVEVSSENQDLAFGIQVAMGMDYLINERFSIRGEMKFRDPEFELKSKYSQVELEYQGETVIIASEKFDSKVNIDGITFSIGLAFHF
jgi:hypothetical protein